jgi:hypothetical protein
MLMMIWKEMTPSSVDECLSFHYCDILIQTPTNTIVAIAEQRPYRRISEQRVAKNHPINIDQDIYEHKT